MAMKTRIGHPSVEERGARGREARSRTPRSSHTGWAPAADRPDPVALLEEQNATREPDLVPVRHGRMLVSPFTFYRGAAKIMAADLDGTPSAGTWLSVAAGYRSARRHPGSAGQLPSPLSDLGLWLGDAREREVAVSCASEAVEP